MIRQGDLLFRAVETIPEYFLEQAKRRENGVILTGEASGHSHRLALSDEAEVLVLEQWRGQEIFVRVRAVPVQVVHEEHLPVTLAPNTDYKVTRAREYDYLSRLAMPVRD
jgi:hypothetical protein